MKKNWIIILLGLSLTANLVFGYTWCYTLQKNQEKMIKQFAENSSREYERNQEQDKKLRLLSQDIKELRKVIENW